MSVSGSQKGLMMPPGLAFNALSDRALAASKVARLPRSYWDWEDMLKANGSGFFLVHAGHEPACTGSVKLWGCYRRKGSPNVFERHRRHAEATRAAVRRVGSRARLRRAFQLFQFIDGRDDARGPRCRSVSRDRAGKIRHVTGSRPWETLRSRVPNRPSRRVQRSRCSPATLSGVEMGLRVAGVQHRTGGVMAALESLASEAVIATPSVPTRSANR